MMKDFSLIDTSYWIEALRIEGKPAVRDRVKKLMLEGRAAWCEMILLELWNGAKREGERKYLTELKKVITCLPINNDVWEKSFLISQTCRSKGITVPATDILIVSCALFHQADIEHNDKHFEVVLQIADPDYVQIN